MYSQAVVREGTDSTACKRERLVLHSSCMRDYTRSLPFMTHGEPNSTPPHPNKRTCPYLEKKKRKEKESRTERKGQLSSRRCMSFAVNMGVRWKNAFQVCRCQAPPQAPSSIFSKPWMCTRGREHWTRGRTMPFSFFFFLES